MEERELLYDDMLVGQEFPPSSFEVTEEVVQKYAEAIGDLEPMYLEEVAADGATVRRRVAHPTLAGVFTRPTRLLPPNVKMPPGSVQSEQRYRFVNPIYPGDTVTTRTRIGDKFIRKERKYVVMEFDTVNQRGETVLLGTLVGVWPK